MQDIFRTISVWSLLPAVFAGGYLLYCVALVVYRLYISALANFPGPKLAAATQWYETYYKMFYNGGGMLPSGSKRCTSNTVEMTNSNHATLRP